LKFCMEDRREEAAVAAPVIDGGDVAISFPKLLWINVLSG
jgi:hypothetical protein